MKKFLFLFVSCGIMLTGCALREYVKETKMVFREEGVSFSVHVRGEEGFIYVIGPYIDFILENQSGKDIYLVKEIIRMDGVDNELGGGYLYQNNEFYGGVYLPLTISNNCRLVGTSSLPDPTNFKSGQIPCSVYIKYQMDGVEKEINRSFEIKVK